MKITMDKELTPVAKAKIVKESMKVFKRDHTDSDILYRLMEQTEDGWDMDGRILSCDAEAFSTTSLPWDEEVNFRIEILVSSGSFAFKVITAYVNKDLDIVDGSNVVLERYEMVKTSHYFRKEES